MEKTRLIIVDDHKMVHYGIGQSLKMEQNFQVDAETDTGRSAVALVAKYRPDVIIMDISPYQISLTLASGYNRQKGTLVSLTASRSRTLFTSMRHPPFPSFETSSFTEFSL
jgi:DNA-binding NarL/FixJ family response regulator